MDVRQFLYIMVNLDKIFEEFNNENKSENDENSLLIDFSDHPLFWISGFNKVMDNHLFFKKYTVKTFKNTSPDMNVEELEKAGEELMFRKAWDYIKSIKMDKPFHIECLNIKANESFIYNLQESISFFEPLEEYEKCALLKNIEIKVKEFLK
jgi:hypothetical protein